MTEFSLTAQSQVAAMHAAFNHPVGDRPQLISEERVTLRVNLIGEELEEYLTAARDDKNLVEVADAIGDLLVVVLGTAVEHGIDLGPIFDRIMESNMSKLGDDGKPVPHPTIPGKFGKSANYVAPTKAIAREIGRQIAEAANR